jgi:D-glycero-beta-D-manno-heptose 1-phosphate adenylyltransferase
MQPSQKIIDSDALAGRLDREPRLRQGLVLANGIFDLLHVGHVRYLSAAREAGERLVVAVNGDSSARRLKGAGRPLVPLEERMEVLAALGCVDWVTSFDEDRVERLLRTIRPAIHAKGTDYRVEEVPERAVARELGIETRIVGDPKAHATRDLFRRVAGIATEGREPPSGG